MGCMTSTHTPPLGMELSVMAVDQLLGMCGGPASTGTHADMTLLPE